MAGAVMYAKHGLIIQTSRHRRQNRHQAIRGLGAGFFKRSPFSDLFGNNLCVAKFFTMQSYYPQALTRLAKNLERRKGLRHGFRMKAKIILLVGVAALLMAGCANPGIVQISPNTFLLSREDHGGIFGVRAR